MNYYDLYFYNNPEATEGHNCDQIYSRVEVLDPNDPKTVLAWLCRVNEDQYNYLVKEKVEFRTWDTIPTTGVKSRIKQKIKDKENKDKSIPTITFGGNISNVDGTSVKSDASLTADVSVLVNLESVTNP